VYYFFTEHLKNHLDTMKLKYFFLLSLSFLLLCCEKESDYRDKMTGTYSFKIIYGFYPYYYDSVKNYTGYIEKSKKSANKIVVLWGVNVGKETELTVDEQGHLSFPEYNSSGHTFFESGAYIKNDSIKFSILSGGLGAWMYWHALGIKTK